MASIILWPKAKSLWYTDEMVNSRIQSWEDMWNIAKEIGMNVNKWIAYSAPAPQAPAPQAPALIVADKQAAFIKYYVKNRQKKEPKYNERKFLEEFRPLADWTFVRRNAPETK